MKANLLLILVVILFNDFRGEAAVADPKQTDVVIVGAGIGGLSAGLEAARGGLNVIVIDMASVFGGHAVMSSGLICFVDTPVQREHQVVDSPELAYQDFLRHGEDAHRDWVRLYVQNSRREIYDWLQEVGVAGWELFPQLIPGNSVRRQHVSQGRGVGLVSPIYRACLSYPNLSFRWNTKITKLLIEAGRVAGVRGVHQRTGETKAFRAAYVILASGGFESNLALVRAHWPHYFPRLPESAQVLLGGGINAVGSGLELVESTGTALSMIDHQLFYSTGLRDPRDPGGKRGLHVFNKDAIWVNAQGKRFVRDGMPDPKIQLPAILEQTPPAHWQIFDAATRPQFFVSGSDWNDPAVVEREIFANPKLATWVKWADTIPELARAAGLPVETLVATVQRWNEMIDRGVDLEFHRFDAASLIRPVKIVRPPFFSVQLLPLARKSLGGVAVDLACHVLDKQGQPIPGLFAVGELAGVGGINGKAALEGTMLGPAILMGRVAAQDIARTLGPERKPIPRTNEDQSASSPSPRATEPDKLRNWQAALRQRTARSRPGYLHFEKSHQVVIERNYDCVRCHREASPLALTEERLDHRALIPSCALCHGGVKD